MSRRVFLRTATAGVTAWSLLGCDRPDAVMQVGTAGLAGASGSVKRGPASQTVSFDGGWLFGPNAAGSDQPGYDDSALETVTLPHTVTPLSWDNWNPLTWERTWVYRKHFDAPANTHGAPAVPGLPGCHDAVHGHAQRHGHHLLHRWLPAVQCRDHGAPAAHG